MWLRKTMTAINTATVLMIQLCRKRTAFFGGGFIAKLAAQDAPRVRKKQGTILMDLPASSRQILSCVMKKIISAIFLTLALSASGESIVAPGAKLEKLA